MTGKFRWTREIPPAAEWFDLDRSETMEFQPEFGDFDDLHNDDAGLDENDCSTWSRPLFCPRCEKQVLSACGTFDTGSACGDIWTCEHCDREFTWKDVERTW